MPLKAFLLLFSLPKLLDSEILELFLPKSTDILKHSLNQPIVQ